MNSILVIIIFLFVVSILYQMYLEKNQHSSQKEYYSELKKKVLNNKNDLPIIWIYIPYEYNARNWCSFGSRSSFDLNQPYLNLTIKSIIKKCEKSFTICLIDDNSFEKLIPNWNINLSKMGDPVAGYIRQLALFKLIYHYGGMILPISFLCLKDLSHLYNSATKNNNMFVVENIDRNVTSVHYDYYSDVSFMGSPEPKNEVLGNLIEFVERLISKDYTSQSDFLGDINRWCNKRVENGKINQIPGNLIGIKTMDNSPVIIETLLGTNEIDFDKNMYGIYISQSMFLKRTKYDWFNRSSQKQILEGNYVLAKYFLMGAGNSVETFKNKPDWISYWRVPSGAPVWGLMPIDLGNDVPRMKYD